MLLVFLIIFVYLQICVYMFITYASDFDINDNMFIMSNFDNSLPMQEAAFKSSVNNSSTKKGRETSNSSTGKTRSFVENLLSEEMEQDGFEALIARRFPRGKGKYKGKLPLKCFSCNKIGHIATRCPDNENKEKSNRFKSKAKKERYLAEGVTNNESEDSEDQEIAFVAIKEESQVISEMTLISRSHHNDDWIIDSGCTHHMTGDKNKFISLKLNDGGSVKAQLH